MEKVEILLSTYNGEKYLEQQLESIYMQDYPNIETLVRDDGSTDGSKEILRRYTGNMKLKAIYGDNIGACLSFFELLKLSSEDVSYYAFCDQDDVWDNNKISHAIQALSKLPASKPALYCTRTKLVDENLHFISYSRYAKRGPSFGNALIESIIYGCTTVINKPLRDLVIKNIPNHAFMHDWWLYLVASAFGTIIYDKEPHHLYRQHSSNKFGVRHTFFSEWYDRIRRIIKNNQIHLTMNQNKEFFNIYLDQLNEKKRRTIEKLIFRNENLSNKIQCFLSIDLYRQYILDDIIFRILLLIS